MENMINAVMDRKKSILKKNFSYEETAKVVTEHLIASRSVDQPHWRPYMIQEGLRASDGVYFDGKTFYPESKSGDVVYVSGDIWIEKDYEVWINVKGRVQVYLDGKTLVPSWEAAEKSAENNEYMNFPVYLSADTLHSLVVKVICVDEQFGFELVVSQPRCPGLWANFYQIMARVVFPKEIIDATGSLRKEEGMGISPLYTGADAPSKAFEEKYLFENTPVYAFPQIEKEDATVDFYKMYHEGNAAFAYTLAEESGYIVIKADSRAKLMIGTKSEIVLNRGESVRIELCKGAVLLIKSMREKNGWGFTLLESKGVGLPSRRKC